MPFPSRASLPPCFHPQKIHRLSKADMGLLYLDVNSFRTECNANYCCAALQAMRVQRWIVSIVTNDWHMVRAFMAFR